MAESTRDQLARALTDGAELTEEEMLDAVVDVSDGHVRATVAHMIGSGALVAISRKASGDVPEATLYRLPVNGERVADDDKPEVVTQVIAKKPSPKKMVSAGRALADEIDRTAPLVADIALPLDRIAALVSVDEFRSYLRCQALLFLSDPAAGIDGLVQARAYLSKLIGTYQV